MRALVDMEGSGLVPMLQQDKYEDLGRMYTLFRRVEGGLDLMRSVLGEHIKDTGRALINDPERTKDPVDFVHKLLEEKDKYDRCGRFLSPLLKLFARRREVVAEKQAIKRAKYNEMSSSNSRSNESNSAWSQVSLQVLASKGLS